MRPFSIVFMGQEELLVGQVRHAIGFHAKDARHDTVFTHCPDFHRARDLKRIRSVAFEPFSFFHLDFDPVRDLRLLTEKT